MIYSATHTVITTILNDSHHGTFNSNMSGFKSLLEMYVFLVHWVMDVAETAFNKTKIEKQSLVGKVCLITYTIMTLLFIV